MVYRECMSCLQESEMLLERWKNGHMDDLLELHNKQPQWSSGRSHATTTVLYCTLLIHCTCPWCFYPV